MSNSAAGCMAGVDRRAGRHGLTCRYLFSSRLCLSPNVHRSTAGERIQRIQFISATPLLAEHAHVVLRLETDKAITTPNFCASSAHRRHSILTASSPAIPSRERVDLRSADLAAPVGGLAPSAGPVAGSSARKGGGSEADLRIKDGLPLSPHFANPVATFSSSTSENPQIHSGPWSAFPSPSADGTDAVCPPACLCRCFVGRRCRVPGPPLGRGQRYGLRRRDGS